MMLLNKSVLILFTKFGIVGIGNTGLFLLIYYIFIWFDPACYWIGNFVGWAVSVANSFFWNYCFVFRKKAESTRIVMKRIGKAYLSYGLTVFLSAILLYVEIDILHWPETICPIFNLLVTVPFNFLCSQFWTFR